MEVNNYTQNSGSISVVIPVYNVASYVERCLLSVMTQTYPAAECIIVDDATQDDSIERCKRLINEYSGPTRFIILHHDNNRGLSVARNTGTEAATSDYIYYLDSDDEITPDCLEKLAAPLNTDHSVEMVMGDCLLDYSALPGIKYRIKEWKEKGESIFMKDSPAELNTNEDVRRWYYTGRIPKPFTVWNKLIRLSFLKENRLYNKEGILWEDTLWTFYLMRCLHHIMFIHDATYKYYFRTDSITRSTKQGEMIRSFGFIFYEMTNNKESGIRIEEAESWCHFFCGLYIYGYNNKHYQIAYNSFLLKLSDGKHRFPVMHLGFVRVMSKNLFGRSLYKVLMKGVLYAQKIGRFVV